MNDKIQCKECDNWYKSINIFHLERCSGLTMEEYKDKYVDAELSSKLYIENLSLSHKGQKPWNTGKKLTEKHCENLIKSHKGQVPWNKGMKYSDEQKEKYKNSGQFKKGDIPYLKGKKHKPESKQKMRISTIKEIEEKYGILPNFNLNGCKFFDYLNKILGWNGQHALNGREYCIIGYFVDYYEPNLNLVIEWDEKHHFDNNDNLSEKCIIRQKEIINYLDCKFIRIKEDEHKSFDEIIRYIKNKL